VKGVLLSIPTADLRWVGFWSLRGSWVGDWQLFHSFFAHPVASEATGGLAVQLPVVSSQHCFIFGIDRCVWQRNSNRGLESSSPTCCRADYWPLATTTMILRGPHSGSPFSTEPVCFFRCGPTVCGGGQRSTLLTRLNKTLASQIFQPQSHDAPGS